MTKHNVPIQSLIDHIKTAIDVDPWAKEMVEELLNEQNDKGMISDAIHETAKQFRRTIVRCKECKHGEPSIVAWSSNYYCRRHKDVHEPDWFCADGEAKA